MTTYKIIRTYMNHPPRTLEIGVTLEHAQEHCQDPENSSSTCRKAQNVKRTQQHGAWFDSYTAE